MKKMIRVVQKSFMLLLLMAIIIGKSNEVKAQATPANGPISDATLFTALNVNYPGMGAVKSAVNAGNYALAKQAYLAYRRTYPTKWISLGANLPADTSTAVDSNAARIARNWLGGNQQGFIPPNYDFGPKVININWAYSPLPKSDPNYDPNFSAGMSRFQFWRSLSNGYYKTRNEAYARAWVNQMCDWVSKNPTDLTTNIEYSVTQNSIALGVRLQDTWNDAYYHFLPSISFVDTAHTTYAKGMLAQCWRANWGVNNFYNSGVAPSNHEILEACGLAVASMVFPEFRDAPTWKADAFKLLMRSFDETVYPDGAENELTPGYANWCRDFYIKVLQISRLNNDALPAGYEDKLKKMYWFDLYVQQPTGLVPPTNDNSDNAGAGLDAASTTWGDPEFLYFTSGRTKGKAPDTLSYRFPWAGFNLMRSGWELNDNYLFFKNGPIGSWWHGHEDGLSLYLTCFGSPLLVEAGSYMYNTSQMRAYVQATSAHNTITVDGKDQHRENDDIFENKVVSKPSSQPWLTNQVADYTSGIYNDGYQPTTYISGVGRKYTGSKDFSVTHKRHIVFLKPYYYVVTDFLEGTGTHKYDCYFQLNAPAANIDNNTKAVKTINAGANAPQLLVYPIETNGLAVKTATGQKTPAYLGWIASTNTAIPTVDYSKTQAAPATFANVLYPYNTNNQPSVNTTPINNAGTGIWACKGTTPYENFAITIRRYDSLNGLTTLTTPLAFTANVAVSIVRQQTGSQAIMATFDSLSAYADAATTFTCDNGNYIVYINAANQFYLYNDGNTSKIITVSNPVSESFTIAAHQWIQISAAGIASIAYPTITILTPANKVVMLQGDTTLITTNIADGGISVSKVDFYDLPTKIGGDTASPYQYVYTASTIGTHAITAKLTNQFGTVVTAPSTKVSVNLFEAEDFTSNNSGNVVVDSARSGLAKVAGINAGGWLEYNLNLNNGGKYTLDINLLNSIAGNTFSVSIDGVAIANDGSLLGAVNIPVSGSYQTIAIPSFDIASGSHKLRVTFNSGIDGVDFNQITFINYYAIPGLIQAENYLKSGSNSAISGHSLINQAAIPESGGGGVAIGNLDSNWVQYAVDVAKAGTYSLQMNISDRYSNSYPGGSKRIDVMLGNTLLKSVTMPSNTYYSTSLIGFATVNTTITFPTVGKQVITLNLYGGSTSLDWMNFAPTGMAATITSPANNSTYNSLSNVNISATATATGGGISKVEFYNGEQLLATDNAGPYSYNWANIPAGIFRVTAKAYDALGNGFYAAPITIVGKNTTPKVSIASPQQYTTFLNGSYFDIAANATDTDGSVASVQFNNGASNIGIATDSPYIYQWYGSATGTYNVAAIATDNLGATTTSKPITISVGLFEAENWIAQQGTDTISFASASNGKEVYKIDTANNYLDYLVNVDNSGQFLLGLYLTNANDGKFLSVAVDGVPVSLDGITAQNISLPISQGTNPVWTPPFDIPAGTHTIRIKFIGGVDAFDYMKIQAINYQEVPGMIKAEDWTINGTDVLVAPTLKVAAYTNFNNITGTSVSGLDQNWVEYAVTVDTPGIYKIDLTLANKYSTTWTGPTILPYSAPAVVYKRVDLLLDGKYQQSVRFPSSTYDSTKTKIGFNVVSTDSFYFPTPGRHILKLYFYGNTINYDSMNLSLLVSTLPVKLDNYTAKSTDGKTVRVEWSTTHGINSDYFVVQRSYDGRGFAPIGKILSLSNGNFEMHYDFIDNNPVLGNNYYRLVEVGKDGKMTYYDVKLVVIKGDNTPLAFSLFPNPLHQSQLSILLPILINGNADIQLVNNQGQIVYHKTMKVNGQGFSLVLPQSLSTGIYTVKINRFAPQKLFISK
ncbi:heparinase II/III family protein [Parasediminibacterium sp. JCM 36343]|uniref:heparinase II/III family protein n=1 Tax=Parasediminibacterium sp. JCM 36343 TaxID=3374279 RepID=UPI0039782E73